MSLVHDALQKAEREKLRKTGEIAPVSGGSGVPAATPSAAPVATRMSLPPQHPPAPAAATPARRAIFPILIAVLIALGVGVFAWVVLRPRPVLEGAAPTAPSAPAVANATARQEPSPPPEAQPSPLVADDPAYKLTGIMKDPEGKSCAILNGRVVYEGHFVDGATIKKIERDRVTLDISGREVVKRLY